MVAPRFELIRKFLNAFLVCLSVLVFAGAGQGRLLAGQVSKYLSRDEIIFVDELRQTQLRRADFLLLDARSRASFNSAHIEGAVLPLPPEYYRQEELFRNKIISSAPDWNKALAEAMKKYPKDKEIVTYCNRDCAASAVLLRELQKLGFTKVRALEDGLQAWEEKGYPMVVGAGLTDELIQ